MVSRYQDQEIIETRRGILFNDSKAINMKMPSYIKTFAAIVPVFICLVFIDTSFAPVPSPKKNARPTVLIFSKTNGFRHSSIPIGIAAIKKLGMENNFGVEATEDSTWFNTAALKKYAALIFLSPTGKVLGPEEEKALQLYIHNGGGYVGIHAAADCEYNWAWYGGLAGAYFKSHPKQQTAKLNVINKNHPSTKNLPDVWERFDEWYNFKNLNPDCTVLIKIDEHSYTGGDNGDNHPMAWYHAYEGGRAFYTALGHTDESYSDPKYLDHILGGIKYAIGGAN
jgi:type 1 glutamine amidotransferase